MVKNGGVMEIMPKKMKGKVPVFLTPSQVREAYRKLVEALAEDWLYEPEVVEDVVKRDAEAQKEFKEGKTTSWPNLKKELGL